MRSLRTTYRTIIEKVTGCRLGKGEIRGRIAFLDNLAGICVGVVSAGLIAESFDTVVRSSWFGSLGRYETVSARIGVIGELAVTIGVFGEFVLHWVYARATQRLEDLTDEESAAQRLEIARLDSEAEAARGAIAEANARAAEANEKAEQEQLARLTLEQSLAPRSITVTQGEALVAELKDFDGQVCEFVTYGDDKEAVALAGQINAVLRAAGWKVEPSKGWLAFMLEFGLSAMVDPAAGEQTRKAAGAFAQAFNKQGLLSTDTTAAGSTGKPDTILVRVGKKP